MHGVDFRKLSNLAGLGDICLVGLAVTAVFLAGADRAFPQGRPNPKDSPHQINRGRPPASVRYRVSGSVDVDRSQLAAIFEISFSNPTGSVSGRARFRLPPPDQVQYVFDSILYRGVRIPDDSIQVHCGGLALPLGFGLPPGERGFVALFGHLGWTQPNDGASGLDPVALAAWIPTLHSLSSDENLPGRDDDRLLVEASYVVSLTVDSSYYLLGPGLLIEERLLYGLLPYRPGVYTGLLEPMLAADGTSEYRPTFGSGRREYTWHFDGSDAFPLIISDNLALDRVVNDSVTIDLHALGGISGADRLKLAAAVNEVTEAAIEMLGSAEEKRLRIVTGNGVPPLLVPEILWLPASFARPDRLKLIVADYFAARHFASSAGSKDSEVSLPLSDYVAAQMVMHSGQTDICGQLRAISRWKSNRLRPGHTEPASQIPNGLDGWCRGIKRTAFLHRLAGDTAFSWFVRQRTTVGGSLTDPAGIAVPDLDDTRLTALQYWMTALDSEEIWYVQVDLVQAESFQLEDTWQVRGRVEVQSPEMVPVEIEVLLADRSRIRHRILASSGSKSFEMCELPAAPSALYLDPDHVLPNDTRSGQILRLDFSRSLRAFDGPRSFPNCVCERIR